MKMRLSVLAVSAIVCLAGPSAHAQPFEDFFDYREPRKPASGDCEKIAAAIGADATWRGEFSGKHYDDFNDQNYPFGLQGCFESELECRIWQEQATTYAGRGGVNATSCRRGAG